MIKIIDADEGKNFKKFINFPYHHYKSDELYVPELRLMQKEMHSKKRNKFFNHGEIKKFIAINEGGETQGRIAAIINRNYKEHWGENYGFFGFFEVINDQGVANKLFDTVLEYLYGRGVIGVYGPMNPSTNDSCGTLIDGFDTSPYIMMVHNKNYYNQLIENYGFTKKMDLLSYLIKVDSFNTKFASLSDKVEKRLNENGITVRPANFKKLKEETLKLQHIYNNAWSKNWGFIPMENAEFAKLVKELKMFTKENLVYIAEDKGEPVAFIALIPNMNEIFKDFRNGRLLNKNIYKLLNFNKYINSVRVLTLGIIEGYRNSGIDAVMYTKCYLASKSLGYVEAEASWILENNTMMNRILVNTNAKVYKTYRIYEHKK